MRSIKIAAKAAVSIEVKKHTRFRIVNTEGGQVVDTWAFKLSQNGDIEEHLSMEHSRSANYGLHFKPGDTLVGNHFQPMLTILADTSPGSHDTLHAACSPGSYAFYGFDKNHPNCQDNLKNKLSEHGIRLQHIPCPWNLFEHVLINNDFSLRDEPSAAQPGDYIELRAETDLLILCSACPSRVGRISGEETRGATVELL